MNKIFKVIWSVSAQRFVVTSELSKAKGKSSSSTDERKSLSTLLKSATFIALGASLSGTVLGATSPGNQHFISVAADTSNPSAEVNYNNDMAQANGSVAIGAGTSVSERAWGGVAIGNNATTNAEKGIAIGYKARAVGNETSKIVIGDSALGDSSGAIVLGTNATAQGKTVRVFKVTNKENTHIAQKSGKVDPSKIKQGDTLAETEENKFFGAYSAIVIGRDAKAITQDVADGQIQENPKDVVVIGSEAEGHYASVVALGSKAKADKKAQAIAVGFSAKSQGYQAVAIGPSAETAENAGGAFVGGRFAKGYSGNGVAIGNEAVSGNKTQPSLSAIAVGNKAKAESTNATAVGMLAHAKEKSSLAIGTGTSVLAEKSGAIGEGSKILNADAKSSYAIGNQNQVGQANTFVLGNNVVTTQANSVVLGHNSTDRAATVEDQALVNKIRYQNFAGNRNQGGTLRSATDIGVVSVGSQYGERQIINVAPGKVSSTSTDAINGSQLYVVANNLRHQMTILYTKTDGTELDRRVKQGGGYDCHNTEKEEKGSVIGHANCGPRTEIVASMRDRDGSTTTPFTLTNVKQTLPDTHSFTTDPTDASKTGLTITKSHELPNLLDNSANHNNKAWKYNNAASIRDVLNTGWNLRANSTAVDFVKPYDTVHFNSPDNSVVITSSSDGNVSTVNFTVAPSSQVHFLSAKGSSTTPETQDNYLNDGAKALGSLALGVNASTAATATGGIAMGDTAKVEGKRSIAIGAGTNASVNVAIAIGSSAQTHGEHGIAFGENSTVAADSEYGIAVGTDSVATGERDIFIGRKAGLGATHKDATKKNFNNIGIGEGAGMNVSGANIIAIGTNSAENLKGSNSIAIGSGANSKRVLGLKEDITTDFNVAIGERTLASGGGSTALGYFANSTGSLASALGNSANAVGNYSAAVGPKANATKESATAIGYRAEASGHSAFAGGNGAKALANHTVALGTLSKAEKDNALAFGYSAESKEGSAIAIGNRAKASGITSIALGAGANATVLNAIAIGNQAKATDQGSVALGIGSETAPRVNTEKATVNGIEYGNFAGKEAYSTVSVGSDTKKRTITNVAAGRINATSTDAINGSQLYMTQLALGNLAKTAAQHLGGGAVVNKDGILSAPSYELVVGNPKAGDNAKLQGQNPQNVQNLAQGINPASTVSDALSNLNAYINKGFLVQENGTEQAPNNKATVTPGEALNFVNGSNTRARVAQEDEKGITNITFDITGLPIQYTTADGNPVAKVGDKYYQVKEDGTPDLTKPIEETAVANLKVSAINPAAKPNQTGDAVILDNVKSGLKPYSETTANTASPIAAPNPKAGLVDLNTQVNGKPISDNTVATVGDLRNMGWVVAAPTNKFEQAVKNANKVSFFGVGGAQVLGATNPNDPNESLLVVRVDAQEVVETAQLPVVYTNKAGDKVVKAGNKFYKADDVTVINGQAYPAGSQLALDGKVYPADGIDVKTGLPTAGTAEVTPVDPASAVSNADVIASLNNVDNETKAPTVLRNVSSGLKTYKDNAATGTTVAEPKAGLVDLKTPEVEDDQAATVGDLRKMGWVIGTPDNKAEHAVKNAELVNFKGSDGINVKGKTNATTGAFEVEFGLSAASRIELEKKPRSGTASEFTGRVKIAENDPHNGTGFVSAESVIDAINASGWNLNASAAVGGELVDSSDKDAELINPGREVNLQAGHNLKVERKGANISFATKENVSFTSVSIGAADKEIKLTAAVANPNTLNFASKDGSPVVLTNVKSDAPVFGSQHGVVNGLLNLDSLYDQQGNLIDSGMARNVATLGDLARIGWVVKTPENGYSEQVRNAEAVNFIGSGSAQVQGDRVVDGEATVVVHVEAQEVINNAQLPVVYTTEDGKKVVKIGGKFYKDEDVTEINNTPYPKGSIRAADGNIYVAGTKLSPEGLPLDPNAEVAKPFGGDSLNAGDLIASMNSGENKTDSPIQLSNVAQGTKAFGPNRAQPTEDTDAAREMAAAVSKAYEGLADLDESKDTNVMTVADAKTMGWVVSTLHGNGYAADVRNANHVDFVGTGLATVKGHTDEKTGIRVITVDVNSQNVVQDAQLPVVYTTQDGEKVVKVGDKFYKDADVLVFDGKVYPKGSVVAANGQVYPEGTDLGADRLPTDSKAVAISPLADGDKEVNPTDLIASMNNGKNDTKAPMPLANVLGTLKQVGLDGQVNNPNGDKVLDKAPENLTKAPNTAAEIDALHNDPNVLKRAATMGDVLNTGFNLQANGKDADFVRHGDVVNFADGTGTTVEFVPSADGKTNTIKVNTVMAYTDENGNKVAKAEDGKYYPVGDDGKPDTTKPEVKNPQVNLVNGDGSTTSPTVLGNVAKGAKVFGPNLFQPTQDTPEAKAMAQNLSNAFDGLADLRNSNPTNVMTVADARNMGWVISTLHGNGYADDVRNANHVDFVGTGLATVKGHTDERTGIRVVTVDVNSQNVVQDAQLPVVYTTQDGERVVKVGDKFYKDGDVLVFDGKVYPKGSVVAADGKVYPEGTKLGTDHLPTDSNVQAISPMDGGTVEPQNLIASMNNGNNDTKAPMKLGNVGGNLAATYNVGDKVIGADGKPTDQAATAPTKEQAAPSAEEAAKMYNNAATVGDVLNAGWNLQANGEAADFVKPYDTVNFKGEGLAKVRIETSDDGKTSNVIIKVDGASVVDNVKGDIKVNDGREADKPKGSVSTPDTGDNKLATTKQVADAINGSGWVATVTATEGGVAEGASDELVNPGEKVTFEAGKNIKLKQEGGKFTIATKDQLELGKADQTGKPGEDGAIKVNAKDGSSATLKVEQGPKGLDGNDGKKGETKTRVVYVKPNGEKEQVATLNDGLSFTGDDETVKVDRKLGQTLNIKGGAKKDRLTDNNIGVVADPATGVLNVKLSKDVNLGDDGSLNVGGVTINQDGINAGGKQIKNVAAGTQSTDAVNVGQLNAAINNVNNNVQKMNKDLRGGVAGALASAGLYHATLPGKSMVAAGVGTYQGQSAVAVGYSRLSDNGKMGVKFTINANTRGQTGASASVGYQW